MREMSESPDDLMRDERESPRLRHHATEREMIEIMKSFLDGTYTATESVKYSEPLPSKLGHMNPRAIEEVYKAIFLK